MCLFAGCGIDWYVADRSTVDYRPADRPRCTSGSPGALTLGTAKLVLTTGTQNTQSSYVFTAEVPLDHHLQMVMQQAAEKYGVPYALLLAIAEQESSFDTTADNGVCYGLMQIHPINYARLRGLGIEPTDTAGNIFAQFEAKKFLRDSQDGQEARDETRRYLNCDLLILDDLGSELTTQFTQSALYELINSRLVAGLHTVISSNLTMDQVRARYTPQIASRLEGEYHVLHFFGDDIRLLKKQQL